MLSLAQASVRELEQSDIEAVLMRGIIGRLAYLRNGEIDVIPVNYVYQRGVVYGRTSGGKLEAWGRDGATAAFEVDEIRTGRDWRSVLLHGTIDTLSPEIDHEGWMAGLGAIRRLQRSAMRPDDPTPDRNTVFRFRVERSTGRAMG